MNIRIRIPLAAIMLVMLLSMSVVPLWLIRGVISQQARSTVEKEVTDLTRGILEAATTDFNHRLSELLKRVDTEGLVAALALDRFDVRQLDLPEELGEAVVMPYAAGAPGVRVFRQKGGDPAAAPFGLQPLSPVDLSRSDTLALLAENPKRRLWLGRIPLFPSLPSGIWRISQAETGSGRFLVALALEREWLTDFIGRMAAATRSTVSVITADNVVLPDDSGRFFAKPWAARAISRVQTGRFINFASEIQTDSGVAEVLVHVYADPDFLYNLVVVTPRAVLTEGFTQSIDRSGTVIFATGLGFSLASLALVLAIARRFRLVREQLFHAADIDFPLAREGRLLGVAEVEHLVDGVGDMRWRLNQALRSLGDSQSQLQATNGQLEGKVRDRTEALELSLRSLVDAQELLVQSEKMAALGRAAATFTHEINSPLGVCNLAASQIAATVERLVREFEAGSLSRSDFAQAAESLGEATTIIERNIRQAVDITVSFKHVAMDQGSGQERDFDLGEYLSEVASTISPRLRQASVALRLDCPAGMKLRCNPAIFYQVVSNLVNNSLLHGFEPPVQGAAIDLAIRPEGDSAVLLVYRDNGCGMAAAAMDHLWEPYFTTKAGRGGSGLGMHIIRSLVTEALGGTIAVESAAGAGVRFEIRFPRGGS
jgi:C4-dicarboxylate-specific signal transduction histidine kinase